MSAAALSIAGAVVGGAVFVLLYMILSVPLWVSLAGAAGALMLFLLASDGVAAPHRGGRPSHH